MLKFSELPSDTTYEELAEWYVEHIDAQLKAKYDRGECAACGNARMEAAHVCRDCYESEDPLSPGEEERAVYGPYSGRIMPPTRHNEFRGVVQAFNSLHGVDLKFQPMAEVQIRIPSKLHNELVARFGGDYARSPELRLAFAQAIADYCNTQPNKEPETQDE